MNAQEHSDSAGVSVGKGLESTWHWLGLFCTAITSLGIAFSSRIHSQVGVVHSAEGFGVILFVLLDVGCVDPFERFHEASLRISLEYSTFKKKEGTYISSRVGVMYPIRVISRNGTWRTYLDTKSRLPTILSFQKPRSRFNVNDAIQIMNLIAMSFKN